MLLAKLSSGWSHVAGGRQPDHRLRTGRRTAGVRGGPGLRRRMGALHSCERDGRACGDAGHLPRAIDVTHDPPGGHGFGLSANAHPRPQMRPARTQRCGDSAGAPSEKIGTWPHHGEVAIEGRVSRTPSRHANRRRCRGAVHRRPRGRLGDDELRDNERAGVRLEKLEARGVVAVVEVDVGEARTSVEDQCDAGTPAERIYSSRSEISEWRSSRRRTSSSTAVGKVSWKSISFAHVGLTTIRTIESYSDRTSASHATRCSAVIP